MPPVAPESGPHSVIGLKLKNQGSVAGTFELWCTTSSPQLACSMPGSMFLSAGQQKTVNLTFTTLGLGEYSITVHALSGGEEALEDSLTISDIHVVGTAIVSHVAPADSATVGSGDFLEATANHASGIASISRRIDGGALAAYPSVVAGIARDTVSRLSLLGGEHSWTSYACAVSGRCDSVTTKFTYVGASTNWLLDDSLPSTDLSEGLSGGTLPGALPLPPSNFRGCPAVAGDPEIRLLAPFSYIGQPANSTTQAGIIYRAGVIGGTSIPITTLNVDHTPEQGVTCSTWSFLDHDQFDANYWIDQPDVEDLWSGYYWGDFTALDGEPSYELAVAWPAEPAARGPNPGSERPGFSPTRGVGSHRGSPFRRVARALSNARSMIPDPGAIDTMSYKIVLNGTTIYDQSASIHHASLTRIRRRTIGAEFSFLATDPLVRRWSNPAPPGGNPYGGWNEIVVSVADLEGHRTSVRARWVQVVDGSTPGNLALTALRDFRKAEAADCAAFGVFQCEEVQFGLGIPGFVSRDKGRGLTLVYRSGSQRAGTIVPVTFGIGRFGPKPDSMRTWATASGGLVSDTLRYAGRAGAPSGANPLADGNSEERAVGTLVRPASSGNASVRTVAVNVRSYYAAGGGQTVDNQVSQQVVQLHLSDQDATRFGQGWTLGELSRLHLGLMWGSDSAVVWGRGDGSYSVFTKSGSSWVPKAGEPVKLVRLASPDSGAVWVISMASGGRIGFNDYGRQAWTADLLDNRTRMHWTGSLLDSIVDPAGSRFEFVANGQKPNGSAATGQIGDIKVRDGASVKTVATLGYDTSGTRLRKFVVWRAPGVGDSTVFEYDTAVPAARGSYLTAVHDPRSTAAKPIITYIAYDTATGTPAQLTLPADRYGVGQANFRPAWRRAVPRQGFGRGTLPLERLVYPSQLVGTSRPVQGPTVDFRLDRLAGVSQIRKIAPVQTLTFPFGLVIADDIFDLERDSATGLVTRVVRGRLDPANADSVRYIHDALQRVEKMIVPTAATGSGAAGVLDTLRFTYDTVTASGSVATGGAWCSRLKWSRGPGGTADTTRLDYGTTGAGKCLPIRTIGSARDTTLFGYGSLAKGSTSTIRPTSVTDAVGGAVTVGYESGSWNANTVTRSAISATETSYFGPYGLVDSAVSAIGQKTSYVYDQSGRVTHTKSGAGATAPVTHSVYGVGGLLDSVRVFASLPESPTEPDGTIQTTRYYYDRRGQLDSLVHPGTRTGKQARKQSWIRDRAGNPIWDFPGNGAYTARTYDWAGRVAYVNHSPVSQSMTSADGELFATATTVSLYGNPLYTGPMSSDQTSLGQVYRMEYDGYGRPVWEVGRDVALGDTLYTRSRSFNAKGALTQEIFRFREADGVNGFQVERKFGYNARGQRTALATRLKKLDGTAMTGEVSDSIAYAYDAASGRLTTVTGFYGTSSGPTTKYGKVAYTWDKAGRDTLRQVYLGTSDTLTLTTRAQFDGAGRRTLYEVRKGGTTNKWYRFFQPTYDKVDDLWDFSTEEGNLGGVTTSTYTVDLEYDELRRLTRSERSLGASNNWGQLYHYDVFGNRTWEHRFTSEAEVACQETTDSLIYGTDNRLVAQDRAPNFGCRPEWTDFLTDQAGNRLARLDISASGGDTVVHKNSYTAAGQLYYSITSGGIGSYDLNRHWYDAGGLRLMSEVSWQNNWETPWAIGNGERTIYVYDGADVALHIRSSAPGSYSIDRRFLVGGIDEPLAGRFKVLTSMKNLAIVADHQGSTFLAIKSDGTAEQTVTAVSRDPFGPALAGTAAAGSTSTGTGFTGAGTPNQQSGFTYLRNRWYDPATGRFLTQDPIGLAGGVNLYAYAGNNPVTWSDPFGLSPDCSRFRKFAYIVCLTTSAIGDLPPFRDKLTPTPPDPVPIQGSVSRPIAEGIDRAGSKFATGFQNTGRMEAPAPRGLSPTGPSGGAAPPAGGTNLGPLVGKLLGALGGALLTEALRPMLFTEPQPLHVCQIEKCPVGTPIRPEEQPANTVQRAD